VYRIGFSGGDVSGVEGEGDEGVWEYRTRRLVLEKWDEMLSMDAAHSG
jgi:hypothetical protein